MLIRRPDDIPSREITDEGLYLGRRDWLRAAGIAVGAASPLGLLACSGKVEAQAGLDDEVTPYKDATTYNNYYEFGVGKEDPSRYAGDFKTRPWSVEVTGDVAKPGTYDLDDLLRGLTTYERIYRMRCVEAWSMVIPWNGVQLGDVIRKLQPGSNAKFIEMTTIFSPDQMRGQASRVIPYFPYVEGLRMDEALHPLTMLATGMYGKTLPNQNGAPLRLVVPWKYGFKGVKAIVKMHFTERQPLNTWQRLIGNEYGFYANVNPEVSHPRWSQARERRIGEFRKRTTLMFNGYADEVASLYSGMDLRRNY